jgi:hypothetical protein
MYPTYDAVGREVVSASNLEFWVVDAGLVALGGGATWKWPRSSARRSRE